MDVLPTTILEAGEWLREGRLTSLELTDALLQKATAAQDTLAAFITIAHEPARAAAMRADAELAGGVDRGPLHGIPIGVKDIIATADAPTTANSRVMDPAWGEGRDATVIARLREAGAIVLGKLGLNEYAIGFPDPDTGFRIPKNPWDLSRFPGGSSSGTGAAVAAGLVLGGLGTDTGGSIRGPASYCGITGIKPTFGLVSKDGCVPLGYSLDNIGPMTRTVLDCALMLQVMAGYDPKDACSVDRPVANMLATLDRWGSRSALSGARSGSSLVGVRLGVPRDYFFDVPELDLEVKAAVLQALAAMESAGATLVDVSIPHAPLARLAQRTIMFAEAYAYHEPDLQSRPELYGKYTRQSIRQGAFFTAPDYVQAQRVRSLVKTEVVQALSNVDVLITPTMLGVAPTFESYDFEGSIKQPTFSGIWNLTGSPAMSVCCGFSSSGLPIGMQIVGKPFGEPTVFKVGDAYQSITDHHRALPQSVKEVQLA
jgi:aspartyl-tRNA(Asn)/glutamyl-tRNA(Gln) amidotransferase subunit A